MPSGSCAKLSELPEDVRLVVTNARRAVLTTIDRHGSPHTVPISFAIRTDEIVTAVDQKPKRQQSLVRLRNISIDPRVSVLFDRWDEDWTRLAWVMVRGEARIERPGGATRELTARYAQYRDDPPRGEVIAIRPLRVTWWSSK